MKKIIILVIVILLMIFIGIEFQKVHNGNVRKEEIKTLLQKPKADESDNKNENNINSASNDSSKSTNSNINSSTNNISNNTTGSSSYIISNDYDIDNKQAEKADKSIDFISGIKDDTNNRLKSGNYGISSSNNINKENDDITLLLAHLIESEAGDEPYQGKLAVASVVLNRSVVDREGISDVIYKAGQFDGVNTSNFTITPSEDSIRAANEVLSGDDVVPDAYYFADLNFCSPDFAKVNTFVTRIGNHWFFRK